MKIPKKAIKSGFALPVYGMGLARVGGNKEVDNSLDGVWLEAIEQALDQGVTHFDTAEAYGAGHSEQLLGKAIKHVDRGKLQIATKVSAWHQSYDGVKQACTASLERLGTDYIDLYIMHSFPETGTAIDKTMRAMTELVDTGLIKNIGASNFTIPRFEAAQAATPHKIVCNQLHYNLQYREVEVRNLVDYCQQQDILLVAWKPIQRGELSQNPLLKKLAQKYSKTWRQVAINWLISQDNIVTIAKTSSLEHLQENLGAVGWTMEPEDIEKLRQDFPDQRQVGDWPLDYKADLPH